VGNRAATGCSISVYDSHELSGLIITRPMRRLLTDEHIARAYGVEVARGEGEGMAFVLPWKPSGRLPGRPWFIARMSVNPCKWGRGDAGICKQRASPENPPK
jgi:hypothetical protein